MKTIAAFDLDGTLLLKNSSFEFLKFLLSKKKISLKQFLYIGGCYAHHKFFFTSYQRLQRRVFNAFFKGCPVDYFQESIPEFLDKHLASLIFPPAVAWLRFFQEKSGKNLREETLVLLLSNSPIFLVKEIGIRLGITHTYGTSYILDSNRRLLTLDVIMDGLKKRGNFK